MIKKFKWFWMGQDDREAAWLGEMSGQGLHLKSLGLFGWYSFERGAPRRYAYYVDFITQSYKENAAIRGLQQMGWQHVDQLGNWHYWRRKLQEGERAEVHLSDQARLEKYQRALGVLVIFLPIFLMQITRAGDILNRYEHWGIMLLLGLFYVLFVLYILALFMTFRRVLTLRRTTRKT